MNILNKLSLKFRYYGLIIGLIIGFLSSAPEIINLFNPFFWLMAIIGRFVGEGEILWILVSWALYGYSLGCIFDYVKKESKNIKEKGKSINRLLMASFVAMIIAAFAIFSFVLWLALDSLNFLYWLLIPPFITLIVGERIFKEKNFNWIFKIIVITAFTAFIYLFVSAIFFSSDHFHKYYFGGFLPFYLFLIIFVVRKIFFNKKDVEIAGPRAMSFQAIISTKRPILGLAGIISIPAWIYAHFIWGGFIVFFITLFLLPALCFLAIGFYLGAPSRKTLLFLIFSFLLMIAEHTILITIIEGPMWVNNLDLAIFWIMGNSLLIMTTIYAIRIYLLSSSSNID